MNASLFCVFLCESLLANGKMWDHKPYSPNIKKRRPWRASNILKSKEGFQLPAFIRIICACLGVLALLIAFTSFFI